MTASATARVTLNLPAPGLFMPAHNGFFAGFFGGQAGRPYTALILPNDPRVHFNEVKLGTYGTKVEGADDFYNGRANTEALAAAGSELCQRIRALDIDGASDLFLPASHQYLVFAANISDKFETDDWYISSTQLGSIYVRFQDFEYGLSSCDNKHNEGRAVAVREIQLSDLVI